MTTQSIRVECAALTNFFSRLCSPQFAMQRRGSRAISRIESIDWPALVGNLDEPLDQGCQVEVSGSRFNAGALAISQFGGAQIRYSTRTPPHLPHPNAR